MREQEKKPNPETQPASTLADKDLSLVAGGKELLSPDQADSAEVAVAITTSIDNTNSK